MYNSPFFKNYSLYRRPPTQLTRASPSFQEFVWCRCVCPSIYKNKWMHLLQAVKRKKAAYCTLMPLVQRPQRTSVVAVPAIFLYSLIMASNSVPAVDFLTNRHTAPWLSRILVNLLSDVRKTNSGTTIVPRHVVTDFSYALINAVLFAFNRMTTLEYLQSRCYISICVSHMIKAMANKLHHCEMEDFFFEL